VIIHEYAACDIPFDPAMLSWPAEPKPFDGVWAPHWYNAAWQSTGLSKPEPQEVTLTPHLQRIAEEARPYYEKIRASRITL
jgi:hypothetical protein